MTPPRTRAGVAEADGAGNETQVTQQAHSRHTKGQGLEPIRAGQIKLMVTGCAVGWHDSSASLAGGALDRHEVLVC